MLVALLFFAVGWLVCSKLSTPGSATHQRLNLDEVERLTPKIQEMIAAHPKWKNISVNAYTGMNGAMEISGYVETEDQLWELHDLIAEEKLPVPVFWRVALKTEQ